VKTNRESKGPSTLVVDLGTPLYRKLQDESVRRSRRENRRVPMTEIARAAIEREIKAKRGG
jgi:hypothetical protein